MELCAPCVADILNDPYDVVLDGRPGPIPVAELAEAVESHAREAPGRPELRTAGKWRTSRIYSLRAVSTIGGVPMCVWHVAERPWGQR